MARDAPDRTTSGSGITPEPPSGLGTGPTVIAEPVRRGGEGESRRVPAGGTAEIDGGSPERVDAQDDDLGACPSVDRPATPRLLERKHGG
jgi:hypothetical protein